MNSLSTKFTFSTLSQLPEMSKGQRIIALGLTVLIASIVSIWLGSERWTDGVWLANAIVIFTLLQSEKRDWPIQLAVSWLAMALANAAFPQGGIGTMLPMLHIFKAGCIAAACRAVLGPSIQLHRIADVAFLAFVYVVASAMTVALTGLVPGTSDVIASAPMELSRASVRYVLSGYGASLALLLALLYIHERRGHPRLRRQLVEAVLATTIFSAGTGLLVIFAERPVFFLLMPFLMGMIYRLSFLGILAFVTGTLSGCLLAMRIGDTPLIHYIGSRTELFTYLQLFLLFGVLTTIPFASKLLEREKLLDDLRDEQARFRLISDHARDVLMRIGLDGTVRYISPSRAAPFGHHETMLKNMNTGDLIHPDDRASFWECVLGQIDDSEGRTIVFRLHCADGSYRWVECLTATARDETTNAPIEIIAAIRDIDDRYRAEQAARAAMDAESQARRVKSDFLAIMSHEIRTPLTAMLGAIQLLGQSETTPAKRVHLQTLEKSSSLLKVLIDDVLDYSKLGERNHDFEQVPFDLHNHVREVVAVYHEQAQHKGLTLDAIVSAECIRVAGDSLRLQQVLGNLISNAIKFTDHGKVDVSLTQLNTRSGVSRWRFEVTDTGIGISQRVQAELFEPFVQGDSSVSRRFGGTGLGLAICRRIVEAMGGKIGVSSTPGLGSTFWFELDLKSVDETLQPARTTPKDAVVRQLRVLVAEDYDLIREVVVEMLREFGHEVVATVDGAAAVEMAQREDFDIIILDMHMPRMDGVSAARCIRELPGPIAMRPIIALTADADPDHRSKYDNGDFSVFLTKPIDMVRLNTAIVELTGDASHAGSTSANSVPISPDAESKPATAELGIDE